METYKLAKLERAIKIAAEEAFYAEVVEREMAEHIIGEGKEYADKRDWIETKIAGWIEEAK